MEPVERRKSSAWLQEQYEIQMQNPERSWVWGAAPVMLKHVAALEESDPKVAPIVQDIKTLMAQAEKSAASYFKAECAVRVLERAFEGSHFDRDMALYVLELLPKMTPYTLESLWSAFDEKMQTITEDGINKIRGTIIGLGLAHPLQVDNVITINISPVVTELILLTRPR